MYCRPVTPSLLAESKPVDSSQDKVKSSQAETTRSIATHILRSCAYCHTQRKEFQRCSKCKLVRYCDENCQKKAWAAHKTICKYRYLIPQDHEIVCLLHDANGDVRPITQEEFKNRTKSTYVNGPIYTEQALTLLPLERTVKTEEKPVLAKSVALHYYGDKIGYGIIALEDIPEKTEIINFGGLVFPKREWNRTHHSIRQNTTCAVGGPCIFDPSEYASLGTFVNDGPSNCELLTYTPFKAYPNDALVPIEKKITTTRLVKRGEQIVWDYRPDHPVKRGRYSLDEGTTARLLDKHSSGFDISLLNQTGWVESGVIDTLPSDIRDKALEIQYILSTPYALALLHLHANLDPETSLKAFDALPNIVRKKFPFGGKILQGLTKICPQQKKEFLGIVTELSGETIWILCKFLAERSYTPSMEDCAKFGKSVDRLAVLYRGSLSGNYWFGTEREEFEKKFKSPEHQKQILDESEVPKECLSVYREIQEKFISEIPR